jgi:hypothetical protein
MFNTTYITAELKRNSIIFKHLLPGLSKEEYIGNLKAGKMEHIAVHI